MTAGPRVLTGPVVLEIGRAAYGLAGVLAPERVGASELGRRPDSTTRRVARLLGGRHLVQALAVLATGSASAHRAGAAVDGVHAVSMVGWAALSRHDRRYYVTSAVLASTLAVLEWRVSRGEEPVQPR